MIDFTGVITLNPESDTWVRSVFVDGGTRRVRRGRRSFTFIETVKIKSEPDTHIRSRNVAFRASGLRPLGRQYACLLYTSPSPRD